MTRGSLFGKMSSSNNTPAMSDRAWLRENGCWTSMHHFMLSYGLKPYNDEDWAEAKIILAAIREAQQEDAEATSAGEDQAPDTGIATSSTIQVPASTTQGDSDGTRRNGAQSNKTPSAGNGGA